MITIRKAHSRFHTDAGWLDSWHTFSFGEHYSPEHMGFRSLRVINDDTVRGGGGFPPHGHRDMEIVSYVLEGGLKHEDSMGTGSVIKPGEIQRMSAGTGVTHSEFNASRTDPVHFLQIWILPDGKGHKPGYEQKATGLEASPGQLKVIGSPQGGDSAVTIRQDVRILAAKLTEGMRVKHTIPAGRHAWVHVARGNVSLNGQDLAAGDGAAISDESAIDLLGRGPSEVLVFDLA